MTKCFLPIVFILLSGCAQHIYNTQLEIHNDCSTSIISTIDGFSNSGRSNDPVNISIEPTQTVRVGTFVGFTQGLEKALPDNYKITIKNNGVIWVIGRPEVLIQAVENIEKKTNDTRFWLLNTTKFCK